MSVWGVCFVFLLGLIQFVTLREGMGLFFGNWCALFIYSLFGDELNLRFLCRGSQQPDHLCCSKNVSL